MDNLANSKTKQAIDKLLHLLKGRGAVSLEEMYTLCGCGYDALAGALSSLIEREGIRIGRIKTRRGWLVDINEGPASPQSGIVWYSERGQLRKILPKLLKELKKYTRTEEESPEYRDNGEIIKTITHLLSDGRPRSKTEIIAETGIEDFPGLVWRHFPRLPDGRFTLPTAAALGFPAGLPQGETPPSPGLLRVFQRHKMITEKLAANNDTAPFVRLTGALITTVDNPEGRLELERRRHQEVCRKTLDSLGFPFFLPEELGLNQHAYKALADSRTLPVKFDGKEYRCLRREFPGEVLIEQLGEISGRYFAPPYTASAPSFLKEHSLGVKEVANLLGLEQEILTGMAEAGEIDHFYLDNRIRFWSSDIQALRKDGSLLQKLAKRRGKLNLAEAAAFLGISIGQIRRLIDDNLLTPVLPDRKNNVYLLRRELEEIQPRLAAILPKYGPAAGRARKQAEIPKERPEKRPVRRDTALLRKQKFSPLTTFRLRQRRP